MGDEPFQAHASWRYNGVHIWGWGGGEAAPAAWLLRGFGARSDSPLSSGGDLTRIELHPPGGGRVVVSSIRLSPPNVTSWIGRYVAGGGGTTPSDSLVWFGQIGVLATRLLAAGRVLPTMVHEHGRAFARWVPQLDEQLAATVAELAAAAPPISIDGDRDAATAEIVGRYVDAFTRLRLADGGWEPPRVRRAGRGQHAGSARARSAFASALVGQPAITPPNRDADRPAFDAELDHMHAKLDGAARRARGEPVVTPRVRLAIPDDPHDDWLLELQLADEIDPGRWCTAADVWSDSPLALDLASDESWLPTLRNTLTDAAARLSDHVDTFRPWRHDDEPATIALDVEAVESFLDEGPSQLDELGVGLIGPEQLVRARVRVRGETRPDDGSSTATAGGRFGRDALVAWDAVVSDGTRSQPVDEAQLARLEAAGAGLLHIGHRWVQIDAEAIRRAQRQLTRFRETRATVGAAMLLRLAADAEGSRIAADDDTDGDGGPATTTGDDGTSVPIEVSGVDGWTRELLRGLGDDSLSETEEPAGFVGELRHYQRRGLSWLRFLADIGLGGCLADDMGLGKTATTLAHLVDRPGAHLVVCPLSVVRNWQLEAQRFTPKLTSMIHHGADRLRDENTLIRLDDFDLVITTYGLLARDVELLSTVNWTTVVLDEAQAIKNAQTRASQAVRALTAGQRLALTGTPIENRLGELWSILDAVNPGMLGRAHSFRQSFAGPIERQQDPIATARLRTLTDPVVLRRTKADKRLLPDLPDKIEQVAFARLTREQVALYSSVVDQLLSEADESEGMQRRGIVLAALTRLKQICNHPAHALADGSRLAGRSGKLDRFDELISDVFDRGDQALVFTQFREMGDLLERHVRERFGITAPFLHGGVARRARDGMTTRFQAGDHPLLLVSLKAGGTGLNLTAASHVVHYDRWWNPAVEDQATDRAWRLGQSRTVMVHKLVTEGTVEERIGRMIDEKRVLADAVIGTGEGESWVSELSTDELRGLVELDPGDEW